MRGELVWIAVSWVAEVQGGVSGCRLNFAVVFVYYWAHVKRWGNIQTSDAITDITNKLVDFPQWKHQLATRCLTL